MAIKYQLETHVISESKSNQELKPRRAMSGGSAVSVSQRGEDEQTTDRIHVRTNVVIRVAGRYSGSKMHILCSNYW